MDGIGERGISALAVVASRLAVALVKDIQARVNSLGSDGQDAVKIGAANVVEPNAELVPLRAGQSQPALEPLEQAPQLL